MLFQYGGGVSRARITEIISLPMVTVIRLLGVMQKRLNTESGAPGHDADPEDDAATIARLEKDLIERGAKI